MRTQLIPTTLMAFSLAASAALAGSEHPPHHGKRGQAHKHTVMMAYDPHHVLAMAYHQTLGAFARALHDQTRHDGSVNVDFARAAVVEMRRSFDQMSEHHEAHMKVESAEMKAEQSALRERMKAHRAELDRQLADLEKEVRLPTPDPERVSGQSEGVCSQVHAMSKIHKDKGSKAKK